jgi:hypothetical protein
MIHLPLSKYSPTVLKIDVSGTIRAPFGPKQLDIANGTLTGLETW